MEGVGGGRMVHFRRADGAEVGVSALHRGGGRDQQWSDMSGRPQGPPKRGCNSSGELQEAGLSFRGKKEGSYRQQERTFTGTLSASWSRHGQYTKKTTETTVGGWRRLAVGGGWRRLAVLKGCP